MPSGRALVDKSCRLPVPCGHTASNQDRGLTNLVWATSRGPGVPRNLALTRFPPSQLMALDKHRLPLPSRSWPGATSKALGESEEQAAATGRAVQEGIPAKIDAREDHLL